MVIVERDVLLIDQAANQLVDLLIRAILIEHVVRYLAPLVISSQYEF